jgi:hypothetical protein
MNEMNGLWRVMIQGTAYDVDLPTLNQWIVEGRVLPEDQVMGGGMNWMAASQIPALAGSFRQFDSMRAAGQRPPVAYPGPSTAAANSTTPAYAMPPAAYPVQTGSSDRIADLRQQQSLGFAIAAGVGAAVVSGIGWVILTAVTGYRLGLVAIGLGALVGVSVRYAGKGIDPIFGVVGAVCALLACFGGNLVIHGLSRLSGSDASLFTFMDFIFCAIATYEGYRFSFRTDVYE